MPTRAISLTPSKPKSPGKKFHCTVERKINNKTNVRIVMVPAPLALVGKNIILSSCAHSEAYGWVITKVDYNIFQG